MDRVKLRNTFTASLSQMYEMKAIEHLVEFWQGELRVLQYIYLHKEEEIHPSVLSDALHVSRARITTALSGLRTKGYVWMEMNQVDRRLMQVFITPDGEKYLKNKLVIAEGHFDVLVDGLGEENILEFIRLIDLSKQVLEVDHEK
jgi:DNA-binding MarR family transcriptional regulator